MTIHHSPHPPLELIERPVHSAVLEGLRHRGDRIAAIDDSAGAQYTGNELVERIHSRSNQLADNGVASGAVVALAAPTSISWLEYALGALELGATLLTANTAAPAALAAPTLQIAGTSLLVVGADDRTWANDAGGNIPIAVMSEPGSADTDSGRPAARTPTVDLDQTAFLLSSSGTSGPPKLVMIPHRALNASVQIVPRALGFGCEDTILLALPLFHAGGLSVALTALAAGACLVTQSAFRPDLSVGALARYRATVTVVVPPMVNALAHHPAVDTADLSALRGVLSTAAPLSPVVEQRLAERLDCFVGQGLGMTEALPISLSVPGRVKAPGSSGPAVPNTELRLVDPETLHDCEPDGTGELWVRGPQLMAGYLDDETATRATLTDDGWLRTGDLCRIDEHGDVVVVDRLKEMIKANGYQVAPAMVEAILVSHPAVADCAVIGVPDERRGEAPVAFVVSGGEIDPAELIDFAGARTPPYARLDRIAVVESIPRSPTGKILRRMLAGVEDLAGV